MSLGPVYEEVSKHVKQFKNTIKDNMSELQKTSGAYTMFNVCRIAECSEFNRKARRTSFLDGV